MPRLWRLRAEWIPAYAGMTARRGGANGLSLASENAQETPNSRAPEESYPSRERLYRSSKYQPDYCPKDHTGDHEAHTVPSMMLCIPAQQSYLKPRPRRNPSRLRLPTQAARLGAAALRFGGDSQLRSHRRDGNRQVMDIVVR